MEQPQSPREPASLSVPEEHPCCKPAPLHHLPWISLWRSCSSPPTDYALQDPMGHCPPHAHPVLPSDAAVWHPGPGSCLCMPGSGLYPNRIGGAGGEQVRGTAWCSPAPLLHCPSHHVPMQGRTGMQLYSTVPSTANTELCPASPAPAHRPLPLAHLPHSAGPHGPLPSPDCDPGPYAQPP